MTIPLGQPPGGETPWGLQGTCTRVRQAPPSAWLRATHFRRGSALGERGLGSESPRHGGRRGRRRGGEVGGSPRPPGSLTPPGERPSPHPSSGRCPGLEEPVCSIPCPHLKARPSASSPGLSALPCPTSAMVGPPRWPPLLEGAEGEANVFPNPFLLPSSSFSQMGPGWWVRLGSSLSPESAGWEKGFL